MKLEFLGSASAGLFAVASTWLAANGSSPTFLIFAAVGALIAVLELEPFDIRKGLVLFLFNGLVGTFGGPLFLWLIGVEIPTLPAAAMILLPFILGWAAHTAFSHIRGVVLERLTKRIKEAGQ
ncbi:hypothetical protein NBRC116590_02620 [Pelagimonas sp. KU-00592-HH]|uniref:hypothetical protein n=1 Tax=Pelagimonas sp. KU-00592-HH TaxID=3127651 RepID=UPI00310B1CB6